MIKLLQQLPLKTLLLVAIIILSLFPRSLFLAETFHKLEFNYLLKGTDQYTFHKTFVGICRCNSGEPTCFPKPCANIRGRHRTIHNRQSGRDFRREIGRLVTFSTAFDQCNVGIASCLRQGAVCSQCSFWHGDCDTESAARDQMCNSGRDQLPPGLPIFPPAFFSAD